MKANTRVWRASVVLILAIVFSMFGNVSALAQTDGAIVEVFRLSGTYVGIKITFPTEISGNFAGTLASKHFDCAVVSSNVLYCIGPFRAGPDPATLVIYDKDTEEIILRKVVMPPPNKPKEVEPTLTPVPTVDPCEENPESEGCIIEEEIPQ